MENFSIACFRLRIQAETNLLLPHYKGSTFRGGFGHALRRVVCITKGENCSECLLYNKCVYSYIFETPPPPESKIMRKYKKAPHPFILIPPLERKNEYQREEILNFGLNFIGKAIDYLPYFIFTFEELGRIGIGKEKGRFSLQEVYSLDSQKGEKLIYQGDQKKLQNLFSIEYPFKDEIRWDNSDNLTLRFLTPARIKYDGSLGNKLEFHILFRNLLRRISSLAYFHCDEDPSEIDFKGLIKKAQEIKISSNQLRWYDWERYSARQDTKLHMGGFVGKVTYQGDFTDFIPWLKAGELVHVGKGTAFGLGKYKIAKH